MIEGFIIFVFLIIAIIYFALKGSKHRLLTPEFKPETRIKDGEEVDFWVKPDTDEVRFYKQDTFAGEGFIYSEKNSFFKEKIKNNEIEKAEYNKAINKKGFGQITLYIKK